MPDPAELVAPAVAIAAACMPLECPEPPPDGEGYEPFGICNLMLKLALGSIAPFMPMLEVVLGLPGSILDVPKLPAKAIELPALPFEAIAGPDLPPIPIPEIGVIGSMDMPELPALGALVFGLLTLPIDIAVGLLKFDIPDLSFDGMLDLVLGAIAGALAIPALMLPTIGLLDLAICVIALIILPVMLILAALGPFLEKLGDPISEGGAGMDIPDIPSEEKLKEMHDLTDEEKREKAEAALNRLAAKEAAKEKAEREAAAMAGDHGHGKKKSGWKPRLGDDFYG